MLLPKICGMNTIVDQSSQAQRCILLLYNTPKAKRYFLKLKVALTSYKIIVAPVGVNGGSGLSASKRQDICAYTMKRKHARERIPEGRLRWMQKVYEAIAGSHYADALSQINRHRPDAIGVWGGQSVDVRAAQEAAHDAGLHCFVFECGLLPDTTTCDPKGVNYANSVPRNPSFYRNYLQKSALPTQLVQRRGSRESVPVSLPEKYFFVPFQVKLDSQVLLYSPWIRSMEHLYDVVVEAWRESLAEQGIGLVFKRHPSCKQSYRHLREDAERTPGICFADGNLTQELIDRSLGVLTVNSSVGLEGVLRDRPVLALGDACYAIPGVAQLARSVGAVGRWMNDVAIGTNPPDRLRLAFLNYLNRDYCIPGSHKSPGPEHFSAIARRFSSADVLVPASEPLLPRAQVA